MKRRILCIFLSLTLCATLLLPATAADFSDTEKHWAKSYIDRVSAEGLFTGLSETIFKPDAPMTRAMFVTVLGRMANIDTTFWNPRISYFFSDVTADSYYAPYVAWAYCSGITNGTAEMTFSPDANITRQEMACFLIRYLYTQGYSLPGQEAPQVEEPEEIPEETQPIEIITPTEPVRQLEPIVPSDPTLIEMPEPIVPLESVELIEVPTEPKAEPETRTGIVTPETPADALPDLEELTVLFADADTIADWALYSTALLENLGIVQGVTDADGQLYFFPLDNATRAECAAVLCRMADSVSKSEGWEQCVPVSLILNLAESNVDRTSTLRLSATVFPFGAAEQTVTWYSESPEIATVSQEGVVTGVELGQACIVAVTGNGLSASCNITVVESAIALGLTDAQKEVLVFGRAVSDPRTVYANEEEALPHMQTVVVKTWDINDEGEKYTREWSLVVHANIADRVAAIFNEIYNLTEKPPIHSLGGYRRSTVSEHLPGLAIDINPSENYYCDPSGKALVGSHFSPETDPYSFEVGGAVDQIFNKYGFTRGIYWSSGYKDYMHYSFFGT